MTVDARERGSGTVLVLGIIGFVLTVFVALVAVGGAVLAAHQAASAADLAAIGAARTVLLGGSTEEACAQAYRVATDNEATVTTCRVRGDDATVETEVTVRGPVRALGFQVAKGKAKAGIR